MHIALVHDAVIPPTTYGGTERVIAWLAQGLLSLGHQVTLLSRQGSGIPGAAFIPLPPAERWVDAIPSSTDIVHLTGRPNPLLKRPYLITIHGNGRPGERFDRNSVFLSKRHASLHHSSHFVYNGINPDEYSCDSRRENYAVFLAKASWSVKNLEGAIEMTRSIGIPLEVLGSRSLPFGLHKLLSRLKPGKSHVHYHGMVGDAEKRRVLRKAKALVFPVRWHEPFGLAIIEAMASGCPVFGTPYGSLPEIVTPDVGYLSTSAAQLMTAFTSMRFSPEKCRQRVLERFTHLQMARSYVACYEQILLKGSLQESEPHADETAPGHSSRALLPWQGLS